ncbi:hypothetical protein JHW43_009540 [Diplocarpon mali]|nr:hypothetical protein JHW43_009540 [Diplocarpon mali]
MKHSAPRLGSVRAVSLPRNTTHAQIRGKKRRQGTQPAVQGSQALAGGLRVHHQRENLSRSARWEGRRRFGEDDGDADVDGDVDGDVDVDVDVSRRVYRGI